MEFKNYYINGDFIVFAAMISDGDWKTPKIYTWF